MKLTNQFKKFCIFASLTHFFPSADGLCQDFGISTKANRVSSKSWGSQTVFGFAGSSEFGNGSFYQLAVFPYKKAFNSDTEMGVGISTWAIGSEASDSYRLSSGPVVYFKPEKRYQLELFLGYQSNQQKGFITSSSGWESSFSWKRRFTITSAVQAGFGGFASIARNTAVAEVEEGVKTSKQIRTRGVLVDMQISI